MRRVMSCVVFFHIVLCYFLVRVVTCCHMLAAVRSTYFGCLWALGAKVVVYGSRHHSGDAERLRPACHGGMLRVM